MEIQKSLKCPVTFSVRSCNILPSTLEETTKEISCKSGSAKKIQKGKEDVNSVTNEIEQKSVTIHGDSILAGKFPKK